MIGSLFIIVSKFVLVMISRRAFPFDFRRGAAPLFFEQGHLAEKLPAPQGGKHGLLAGFIAFQDFDVARQHDIHVLSDDGTFVKKNVSRPDNLPP